MNFKLKLIEVSKNLYKYFYLTISLLSVFLLMSLYEVLMSTPSGSYSSTTLVISFYKFLNDFWTVILISLLFFPLYIIVFFLRKKIAHHFFLIVFLLLVLAQFSLIKYSLTTLINLGTDLLGYSLSDIKMTVSSSESFSLMYFMPFIGFPALFLLVNFLLNKKANSRKMILIFGSLILIFGSFKLILQEASLTQYQNKLYFLSSDIITLKRERIRNKNLLLNQRNDFPLLKLSTETEDVLGPFFNIEEEKPTIVMLIVEGLGSEFVGNYAFAGFTPYLDSLIDKSLYWKNFLSTTSRSFGIMPALLGSLPYGEMGFLELSPTPSHISLINVLKQNGYSTSFYAGHKSSFDRKINFLEYNDIDYIIDEDKFGPGYTKTNANSEGFSWGYSDFEIMKKTLVSLDGKKLPRLDIVRTQTNHEPFDFPLKDVYIEKIDSILINNSSFAKAEDAIRNHIEIYASLLYTDDAVKMFMDGYSKRPEFSNTIFIITGDHRVVPVPQKDKLSKYHVPMFIYSPLLKKTKKINSISSHLDVAPSLLAFLTNNYKFNELQETSWVGNGLDTVSAFRNIHEIPLMRYKGKLDDFIVNDNFYSDGELFKIDKNFGTDKIYEEELLKSIKSKLTKFKDLNAYVTQRNKIFPDSLNIYVKPTRDFSEEEMVVIKKTIGGLIFDDAFIITRDIAFNKDYKKAQLLCDYILNELPNHSDARTLKGKIFAWEKKYKAAELELLNVIKRNPYYDGAYLAIIDLYWWSDKDNKALLMGEKAKLNKIDNPEISYKIAQAHKRMNNVEEATKLIDSLLVIQPRNKEYITFKKTLE